MTCGIVWRFERREKSSAYLWDSALCSKGCHLKKRLPKEQQTRGLGPEVSESHFFILETRMRVSLIQSRTSRRDREFLTLNLRLRDETEKKTSSTLRHRDEIEIYYGHSQASRRDREFPWSNLGFQDENENFKSRHLSLNSGLNGLTILHTISRRLLYKIQGSTFCLMFSHFEVTQSCSPSAYVVIFQLLP